MTTHSQEGSGSGSGTATGIVSGVVSGAEVSSTNTVVSNAPTPNATAPTAASTPIARTQPLHSPLFAVRDLIETRYLGADSILLAGSVIRGEASTYSDLDVVVLYPHVRAAYRESFTHKGWPVEAFIHDLETLRYFVYRIDRPQGISTLSEMIREGLEVPGPTELSSQAKTLVNEVLGEGPPALTLEDVEDRRYHISELIDDLREPRSRHELNAAASRVYGELADFYCRSKGHWTGAGKGLLKRMKQIDPSMARRYADAFDQLFQHGLTGSVVSLSEEILAPFGGFLFDAYRREVSPNWRGR